MGYYRLDLSSPPDWQPLSMLSRLLLDRPPDVSVDTSDYMYMGRLVACDAPVVHLYKERRTRAYLCLDRCGHAYRVSRSGHTGIEFANLIDAVQLAARPDS